MSKLTPVALIALCSSPAAAQDWTGGTVARALETPAHEALMTHVPGYKTNLNVFTTDGCSGGLSEAWQVVANRFPDFAEAHQSTPPWEDCCVTHDETYHIAGRTTDAVSSFTARLEADQALKACVIDTGAQRVDTLATRYNVDPDVISAAYASIAQTMFIAVRFGGGPCSGMPWRWGYGFPSCAARQR